LSRVKLLIPNPDAATLDRPGLLGLLERTQGVP
jgi:hypothetical protein